MQDEGDGRHIQLDVDRDWHDACPHRPQQRRDELDPIECKNADPITWFQADFCEAARDGIAHCIERAIAHLPGVIRKIQINDRSAR